MHFALLVCGWARQARSFGARGRAYPVTIALHPLGLCNDGDDDGTCCQGHLVIAVRRYGIPPKLLVRRNGEGCSSVWRVIASLALVKTQLVPYERHRGQG